MNVSRYTASILKGICSKRKDERKDEMKDNPTRGPSITSGYGSPSHIIQKLRSPSPCCQTLPRSLSRRVSSTMDSVSCDCNQDQQVSVLPTRQIRKLVPGFLTDSCATNVWDESIRVPLDAC
jgi:hypothetical protein